MFFLPGSSPPVPDTHTVFFISMTRMSCTLPLLHKEHGLLEERACFTDCIDKLYSFLPADTPDTKRCKMVIDYLYIKVTDLILLSSWGWQVLCLCYPPVHLCLLVIMVLAKSCTFWSGWVQSFSHHLRPCVWAILMNKFSAVETILYSSWSIMCQALPKISYKARGTSKKFRGVFRIKCEISCDSGCLSLTKEVQISTCVYSYLSGTAIGHRNLTVESYSIIKSHGKNISC